MKQTNTRFEDQNQSHNTYIYIGNMSQKRVMISVNASWNIYNFRAGLIRHLIQQGYDVTVAAPTDAYSERVAALGCQFLPLHIDNKGRSPLRDGLLFLHYYWLLRRQRPSLFLSYTIKPNVWGSLAAHLLGIPVINNISGLGTVFLRNNWLTILVKLLYRLALRPSRTVFFQNAEDRDLFVRQGIVRAESTELLPGSGIDLERFRPTQESMRLLQSPAPVFLLIARLIWDKGVGEYVEAARLAGRLLPQARFQILGMLDVQNPNAIPRAKVEAWVNEGVVDYLGKTDDVRPFIAAASCVVLPSYYPEGTPRTLLEAAAMGKPLITTGTPGCRTVVDDGINGFLCAARDPKDLAAKLLAFAGLDPLAKVRMGLESRKKAEIEFDEEIVFTRYRAAIERALRLQRRRRDASHPHAL